MALRTKVARGCQPQSARTAADEERSHTNDPNRTDAASFLGHFTNIDDSFRSENGTVAVMKRFLARVVAGATAVLALSGCIKIDMDMKVKSNDRLDGTFIVGFSTQLIELMGQKKSDFIKSMKTDTKSLPKGAKTSTYDKNGFVGTQVSFKDLPVSEFTKVTSSAAGVAATTTGGASGDDLKLVKSKDGKSWNFSGTMDLKGSSGTDSSTPDLSAITKGMKAEVRIKMTFPGKITKHDRAGKVSGNTITWTPKMGEKIVMQATANAK